MKLYRLPFGSAFGSEAQARREPQGRRPLWFTTIALAAITILSIRDFRAVADTPKNLASAPPLAAAKEMAATGLMATVESGGKTDRRTTRLAALYVPANTPPTPFLPAGPFRATFEGNLMMKLRDEITFSFAGNGSVKLLVNDALIFDRTGDLSAGAAAKPIRLAKGKNKLVIQYQSPKQGDGWFRLCWSASDFPAEPIPPVQFAHNAADDRLRAGERLREGRHLFAQHMCASCHAVNQALQDAIHAVRSGEFTPAQSTTLPMPDLAKDAPNLAGSGSRVNEAWLAHWISDPSSLRADATMPRVFHTVDGNALEPAARDIAAFLMTLTSPNEAKAPEITEELAIAGGRLFVHLQCIACHQTPGADAKDDEFSRISLRHIRAKYRPAALRAFLANPQAHYTWIRMPDFKLNNIELSRLTAFLLFQESKHLELPPGMKGDPARGKDLLNASGCLNCHNTTHLPGLGNTFTIKPLADLNDWSSGCLATDQHKRGKAPHFSFTPAQRDALLSFASTDRASLARESLSDFTERNVTHLRCNACHARDDAQDIFSQLDDEKQQLLSQGEDDPDLGEEDEKISPDQSIPMLTWAGEKLRPEWTAKFIAGKLDTRYRPWLRARMPAFPARAACLAHGLPLDHGFAPTSLPDLKRDDQLAEIGRTLVGKEGGFACMTCHGVGDTRPVGVFEAPGPNLRHSRERLNPHYYTRWVYNPLRVHRDSKMPAFADSEGKTSLLETLDGDARKQYDAIWHYLLHGQQIQAPEN